MSGMVSLLFRRTGCPVVMGVAAVGKRDQETCIGDPLHFFEKPFRVERSLGPRTAPANRINDCEEPEALALSNWSRTSCP